jgi:N-acetylmuramoyl-L-alanine amidase
MRRMRWNGWSVLIAVAIAGCSAAGGSGSLARSVASAVPALAGPGSRAVAAGISPTRHPSATAGASAGSRRSTDPRPDTVARPLAGKIIGIDPGHNGGNFTAAAFIDALIWNGRETETCDTTGTTTASGYTEAQFNFGVARYLRADLIADGAKVVMTRDSNTGVGPCVTTRAQIINRAHADVAIDIHADGGPYWGRGFTVLEPVADGPNNRAVASSIRFGADVRTALLRYTGMPQSTYDGTLGVAFRNDLAGLNLTTVPKILIECGNMRNGTDAALLVEPGFQRLLARTFTAAIVQFLTRR